MQYLSKKNFQITNSFFFFNLFILQISFAVAVGLNVSETTDYYSRPTLVSNSLLFGAGGYLIILGFFLGWTIFQEAVHKGFAAIILICGFLWNVGGELTKLFLLTETNLHNVLVYNYNYII